MSFDTISKATRKQIPKAQNQFASNHGKTPGRRCRPAKNSFLNNKASQKNKNMFLSAAVSWLTGQRRQPGWFSAGSRFNKRERRNLCCRLASKEISRQDQKKQPCNSHLGILVNCFSSARKTSSARPVRTPTSSLYTLLCTAHSVALGEMWVKQLIRRGIKVAVPRGPHAQSSNAHIEGGP